MFNLDNNLNKYLLDKALNLEQQLWWRNYPQSALLRTCLSRFYHFSSQIVAPWLVYCLCVFSMEHGGYSQQPHTALPCLLLLAPAAPVRLCSPAVSPALESAPYTPPYQSLSPPQSGVTPHSKPDTISASSVLLGPLPGKASTSLMSSWDPATWVCGLWCGHTIAVGLAWLWLESTDCTVSSSSEGGRSEENSPSFTMQCFNSPPGSALISKSYLGLEYLEPAQLSLFVKQERGDT